MTSARPEVWANCAISVDGRLAYAHGRRARLSGPEDLARVQRIRAEVDAIVVGVGTVLLDDPSLRVHWELLGGVAGREPTRVVLDSQGRTPPTARVLDGSRPTIVAVASTCRRRFPETVRTIVSGTDQVELPRLFGELQAIGIRRLLVEGGGTVLASLLRSGLFDRLTVYVAPVVIGGRSAPSLALGPDRENEGEGTVPLARVREEPLGEGSLLEYRPRPAGTLMPPAGSPTTRGP